MISPMAPDISSVLELGAPAGSGKLKVTVDLLAALAAWASRISLSLPRSTVIGFSVITFAPVLEVRGRCIRGGDSRAR